MIEIINALKCLLDVGHLLLIKVDVICDTDRCTSNKRHANVNSVFILVSRDSI